MKKVYSKLSLVLLICALMAVFAGCEIIDQLGGGGDTHTHNYTYEITKSPSCSEEGVKTFTCSCNDSYTEAISKIPHTTVELAAVAPTCAKTGLTAGKKCSICDEVVVAQEVIEKKAHTEVIDAATQPTCTEAGKTEGKHCSECGEVFVAQETIEANGHTEVIDAAVEATCTEAGKTEGKHCTVCGEVTVAQETIPASGHNHSDEWIKNDTQHWHECSCGDKTDLADHNFADATDTSCECGFTRTVAPTLSNNDIVVEHDLFALESKESLIINFAENVNNHSNLALTYSVKCGEDELALDGALYTLALGSYTDEVVYKTFTVTVSYEVNGEAGSITYTYKLGLKDTSAYRVANGNFENDLEGWTLTNTAGEAPFAGIDEKTTFWGEGYPMYNVGKYFSSYADGASEASQGTLASPYFVVNSEYATYMLGGAGNHNVYITIENKDGEVLALYRNTKFTDFPAGEFSVEERREMIGNTVFLANFVTYKVSLADFAGEEVRFVIHDYASSGWGVVYFDELNTYYAAADAVPENAILAENLLANKDALNEELALEVTEQGDYTLDSYNAYLAKLDEAIALVNDIAVTQATVDQATKALTEARLALAVRPVEEVADANKAFALISGNSKEVALADFINTNGLSSITYELVAGNELVTLSQIADGKFTVTAGDVSEATTVTVSIIVYYNGTEKLAVELSVQITKNPAPTVFNEEVVKEYDLYDLENKENITIDFAENVDNAGNLELTYSVKCGEVELALDGTLYTVTFGSYNDVIAYETFTVTVSYVINGEEKSISYTYKLGLKDTTAYRLANGGFENGLEGWTQSGNIGGVSSDKNYWVGDGERPEGFEFGMDGSNMFSAYAPGAEEGAFGTLTSSTFTVGGSGYVTFKLGAMKNGDVVYMDVIDADTKEILARYYNGFWADRTNDVKSGCTLVAYVADLTAFKGHNVYFRITDKATNDYGLFFADSFVTYYESKPEGFNDATLVNYEYSKSIYEIYNGSFETGNTDGWKMDITEAGSQNTLGWVLEEEDTQGWYTKNNDRKDGRFLFTFLKPTDVNCESSKGTLTSSTFTLKQNSFVSFRFGGAGNSNEIYIQLCRADGTVIATFNNNQPGKVNTEMYAYCYEYTGEETDCFFRLVDYSTGNYGCFVVDDFRVNLESAPEGFGAAITQ